MRGSARSAPPLCRLLWVLSWRSKKVPPPAGVAIVWDDVILQCKMIDWHLISGYVIFTLYTLLIMIVGVLLEKKTNIDKTICRKLTHISSAFIWVICYFFFGCSIHWVILNGISTVLIGFVIFNNKINIFARDDARKSVGLFYFCLSYSFLENLLMVILYLLKLKFYIQV
mgnify:CR=1 FL=1